MKRLIISALAMLTLLMGLLAETSREVAPASRAEAEEAAEAAGADFFTVEDLEIRGLALGESSVSYPAFREGTMAEETLRQVNDRILEDGGIRDYLTRMSQLISGGKITVTWRGERMGPVFSFAVDASGAVTGPRLTHVWTGGNIDLRDGHEITLDELFSDPEGAGERMEAYLEERVAPELSAHLQNGNVTPLPDRFRMTPRGLIWMYPIDQLSTLSDRAGDILIPWHEIAEWMDLSPEGLPAALGVTEWLPITGKDSKNAGDREPETAGRTVQEENPENSENPEITEKPEITGITVSREAETEAAMAREAETEAAMAREAETEAAMAQAAARIRAMTTEGRIPGIPAALGDDLSELTDAWHLLTDPDIYAGGRFFALEGAEFRNVFLMTDFLSESWEDSVVDGIRVDEGSVYSLTVGVTTREEWRALLGTPDFVIEMDEETAEAWRTVAGSRDYYVYGSHRLQLQGDEMGLLTAVILSE